MQSPQSRDRLRAYRQFGIERAAWRVDGQIVDAYTSNSFRLCVRLSGGSGIAENFFAGGWLETAKDNVLATRGISGSC